MVRGSSLTVVTLLCLHVAGGSYWDHVLQRLSSMYVLPPQVDAPTSIDDAIAKAEGKTKGRSFHGRSLPGKEMTTMAYDMVVSPEQLERLQHGSMERSSGRSAARPWTGGVVPYQIQTSDYSQEQLDWIQRAMRNWERRTCIRFVRATPNHKNRLIIKSMDGCWAHLGMQGGTQFSSLSNTGCFWKGTVEHELGHAMGLIHEHQRPNRDDHVRINYFAVKSNNIDQLTKYAEGSDDKYGLSYDYNSVMHYGKSAFSDHPYAQTIFPLLRNKTDVIGTGMGPSFTDFKLINLMYQCNKGCKKSQCAANCYQNKTCGCVCEKDIPKEVCEDHHENCEYWASVGQCTKNEGYMLMDCRKTCRVCSDNGTVPHMPCADLKDGECTAEDCSITRHALRECKKFCGLCDNLEENGVCRDKKWTCRRRAQDGECDTRPEVMLRECRASCKFCPGDHLTGQCVDYDSICQYYKESGYCVKYAAYMSQKCRKACGNCNNELTLPEHCVDYHPHCFSWARKGVCSKAQNVGYMRGNCKKSCNLCNVKSKETCYNRNPKCTEWKDQGLCSSKRVECPRACGVCAPKRAGRISDKSANARCEDKEPGKCPSFEHYCASNDHWVIANCKKTCKLCSECEDKEPGKCPSFEHYCASNDHWVIANCKKTCKLC